MKEYTYSEARQRLADVLDVAGREGEVRIRRQDGQVFVLKPYRSDISPLDVGGPSIKMTKEDILEAIREGRRPT